MNKINTFRQLNIGTLNNIVSELSGSKPFDSKRDAVDYLREYFHTSASYNDFDIACEKHGYELNWNSETLFQLQPAGWEDVHRELRDLGIWY